jgi:hypothetical protein
MEVFKPCTQNNFYGECPPEPPAPFIGFNHIYFLYDVVCPEDWEFGQSCPFVLFPFPNPDSPNSGESSGLGDSGGSYSLDGTNGQYFKSTVNRVEHSPTVTCYLKIWVKVLVQNYSYFREIIDGQTIITLEPVGEPQELSDFDYQWNGNGRPCIQDPSKRWDDEENQISAPINWEIDVGTPSQGTAKTALIYNKSSIIEGYEPPWPEGVG